MTDEAEAEAEAEAEVEVEVEVEVVRFNVRPRNPSGRTEVEVRLNGKTAERVRLSDGEHRFELAWPNPGLVYVELFASDPRTGKPVRLYVIVPKTT